MCDIKAEREHWEKKDIGIGGEAAGAGGREQVGGGEMKTKARYICKGHQRNLLLCMYASHTLKKKHK